MYKDNSLIPSESVRLAALGILAQAPKSYAELASEVRHFSSRIVGPSLELMGPSLELLRVEGLVKAEDEAADHETAVLSITEAGRGELRRLLTANLRGPIGEVNKLIIALKMRFLHLLDPGDQQLQAEILADICEKELARLTDLRQHHAGDPGHLVPWLDHDIGEVEGRLAWFRALQDRL
jgi:DNA-binding PadR family transcriptional regulator